MPRDEFSPNTKELLAKRVSYKCSNPACRRITVGANSDSNKTTNIGVASHIYAAAPGGPRYNAEMTVEERKSPDNGIWLCQSCSVMIDKDTEMYPIQLLKQWKEEAEQEARDAVNNRLSAMEPKFRDYYQNQIDAFEMNMDDDSIVGDEPLESAYLEAYTIIDDQKHNMLNMVEKWYEEHLSPSVLILFGQPGHGKTTFCKKAVYEFAKGRRFQKCKPKYVLWFKLNQPGLISEQNIYLDNIFHESDTQNILATWRELKHSIIFLDGFDEIKLQLSDTAYSSWERFSNMLSRLGRKYRIHFIVTSRTNALINEPLGDFYRFASLDDEDRASYCNSRDRYKDYWNEYLKKICEETEDGPKYQLKQLLEIPFIFRMVIEQQYHINDIVNNQANLYEDLFFNTFGNHELSNTEIENYNLRYQSLAYDIWCDDEDTAEISEEKNFDVSAEKIRNKLLFSYYLKNGVNKRLGYIHRSIYQYYLALYFYEAMNGQKPKEFLKLLAERRIDDDCLEFFSQIAENKGVDKATEAARTVIRILNETEAVIETLPKNTSGTAEKSIFNRCSNIFYNAIQLCFIFDVVEIFNMSKKVKSLICKYDSSHIQLYPRKFVNVSSDRFIDLSKIDLSIADLYGADLREANLKYAHLYSARLSAANLSGTNLSHADLSRANLGSSILERATLSNAYLVGADLGGAKLCDANLNDADLEFANLYGADLSDANLRDSDLSETCLTEAYLDDADLVGADFKGADLRNANLRGANLNSADLRNASLVGADLSNVDLTRANLRGADLRGADLTDSTFNKSEMGEYFDFISGVTICTLLKGTKFTQGALDNVDTSEVDLSEVIWFDKDGNPINK